MHVPIGVQLAMHACHSWSSLSQEQYQHFSLLTLCNQSEFRVFGHEYVETRHVFLTQQPWNSDWFSAA